MKRTADDLPVPPIPPTTPLLTTVSLPGVTAVPLQARPVTPRLANVQSDDKPRANAETRITDEPRAGPPKPLPLVVTEPRQAAPGPANGQAVQREHELPPLQAQTGPAQGGYVPAQKRSRPSPPHELQARASPPPIQHAGLPPLQAQGASQPQNPGQPLGPDHPMVHGNPCRGHNPERSAARGEASTAAARTSAAAVR